MIILISDIIIHQENQFVIVSRGIIVLEKTFSCSIYQNTY